MLTAPFGKGVSGGFPLTTEPLGGTTNVSSPCKQANINAPGIRTEWDDSGVARRKTERRRKALLASAQRVIRERYPEFDLALGDIAEDVGCSPRQLQRIFRELAAFSALRNALPLLLGPGDLDLEQLEDAALGVR